MARKSNGSDSTGPRTLTFNFGKPVTVKVYTEIDPQGKPLNRLELETTEGPAEFTYSEFVRFAQTMTVLLRPSVLLED